MNSNKKDTKKDEQLKIDPIIVSACLLGVCCRYDSKSKLSDKVLKIFKNGNVIPVCPEQLGGLPTPRVPAEIQNDGRVLNKDGKDVTENFKRGAEETLKIAKVIGAEEFIVKSKSASCGFGKIYDGTFSGNLIDGKGITSDLLSKNNIKIITEKDL